MNYVSIRLSLKSNKTLIGETTTKTNRENVNGLIVLRERASVVD